MIDEIVKIPPTDKWIGSCPICGKAIWASYFIKFKNLNWGHDKDPIDKLEPVYKCIECKEEILAEQIIPF